MYSYVIKLIFVIQLPIISASGCRGYVNYSSKNRTTPGNIVQLWARLGCVNNLYYHLKLNHMTAAVDMCKWLRRIGGRWQRWK